MPSNTELVELVDRVMRLIDEAEGGNSFILGDLKKSLADLKKSLASFRKPLTTTTPTTSISRDGEKSRIRKSWSDSVALYKWGQRQSPKGSTLAEIHAYLAQQRGKYPGELKKCRLAKLANFKRYVRGGGANHRDLKAGRT